MDKPLITFDDALEFLKEMSEGLSRTQSLGILISTVSDLASKEVQKAINLNKITIKQCELQVNEYKK